VPRGCGSDYESRVQHAFNDVPSTIHQSLAHGPGGKPEQSFKFDVNDIYMSGQVNAPHASECAHSYREQGRGERVRSRERGGERGEERWGEVMGWGERRAIPSNPPQGTKTKKTHVFPFPIEQEAYVKFAIDAIDENNDGVIDRREFKNYVKKDLAIQARVDRLSRERHGLPFVHVRAQLEHLRYTFMAHGLRGETLPCV